MSLAFVVSPLRTGILAGQLRSWTGTVGRYAALRASWAAAIVMTAAVRMCSSGSPGSWPLVAADVRCLMPRYTSIKKLANIFRNLITYVTG